MGREEYKRWGGSSNKADTTNSNEDEIGRTRKTDRGTSRRTAGRKERKGKKKGWNF